MKDVIKNKTLLTFAMQSKLGSEFRNIKENV